MTDQRFLKLAASSFCTFLVIFLYILNSCMDFNADSAVGVLESIDWLKGNFLLLNWDLSELNFYFSETLPKALLLAIGFSPLATCYLAPAIYWALVNYLAACLVLQRSEKWTSLCFVLSCLSLPSIWFMQNIVSNDNIHIGCLIGALWLLCLMKKRPTFLTAFFLSIFVSLMIFSDPLFVSFFCLPILFLESVRWLSKYRKFSILSFSDSKSGRIWFWIVCSGLLLTCCEYLCLSFFEHWKQYPETHIDGISAWGKELQLSSIGALGFFTELPRHFSFQAIIVFSVFITLFCISCFSVVKGGVKKAFTENFQDRVLLCGAFLGFVLATLKMSERVFHIRYALPAIVFAVIFIARNLTADKKRSIFIIGASVFFLALHFIEDISFAKSFSSPNYQKILQIFRKHHEVNCFSEYEAGSNIMLRLPEISTSAPIEYRKDGKMHANQFLAKRDWYEAPCHCYISHRFSDVEKMRQIYPKTPFALEKTEGYYLLFLTNNILLSSPLFE